MDTNKASSSPCPRRPRLGFTLQRHACAYTHTLTLSLSHSLTLSLTLSRSNPRTSCTPSSGAGAGRCSPHRTPCMCSSGAGIQGGPGGRRLAKVLFAHSFIIGPAVINIHIHPGRARQRKYKACAPGIVCQAAALCNSMLSHCHV